MRAGGAMHGYTENERWYLALTDLWAAQLRAGDAGIGVRRPADADLDFAVAQLGLTAASRVLDLGCGWGRTTLAWARRGYDVTGFDLSPALLSLAREQSATAGLAIPYRQGTVRRLPDLGRFDTVTAFYDDSLISFEAEADNLAALRGVARSLTPGGRLLFGTTDCPLILPPRTTSERWHGDTRVEEAITFDQATLTGTSVRRHHEPDGRTATYRRRRRHYPLPDVRRLLSSAGLRLDGAWCAYDVAMPFGARPEGMVIAATRVDGDRAGEESL